MSLELTAALIAIVAAVISIACADYARRVNKRRKKQQDKERRRKEAEQQFRRQMMTAALERFGVTPVQQVKISGIKYGQEVCWISPGNGRHEHYTAGYDGDPGPSTEGIHARKITPEGL